MRLYVPEGKDDDRLAPRWEWVTRARRSDEDRRNGPSAPPGSRMSPNGATESHGWGRRSGWFLATVHSPAVPRIALAVLVAGWMLTFLTLGWQRHARFRTFGFDVGIFDQAVWLLAHGHEPFVTVRGLHIFGNHASFVLLLFAPFYRLGAGPHLLLTAQVISLGLGAVAVYGLATTWVGRRWIGFVLAAALLLHPAYQFLAWEHFQPETLATGPLLAAVWAAWRERWGWYAVAVVIALACKENVALAVLVLGLVLVFRGHRRIGLVTAATGFGYFLLAVQVVIPEFAGGGPFYQDFFPEFGTNLVDAVAGMVTSPVQVVELATRPDRLHYLWQMFAPFGLLVPLLGLPLLSLAAPQLLVNLLGALPYQREIRWHHAALVLVGLILATVTAMVRLRHWPRLQRLAAGGVLLAALAGSVLWGPSPIGREFQRGSWPLHPERMEAKQAAVAAVPSRASVSASYYLIPHLTHRPQIYEFPVPWTPANWGLHGEGLPDPGNVRWLAVDRRSLGREARDRLESLLSSQFAVRFEQDGIVVAERTGMP